jgi:hypothetical protein
VHVQCVIYITGICVFRTQRMGEMARLSASSRLRDCKNSPFSELAKKPIVNMGSFAQRR